MLLLLLLLLITIVDVKLLGSSIVSRSTLSFLKIVCLVVKSVLFKLWGAAVRGREFFYPYLIRSFLVLATSALFFLGDVTLEDDYIGIILIVLSSFDSLNYDSFDITFRLNGLIFWWF